MDAPCSLHPTDETLQLYGLGKLTHVSTQSVKSHVDGCPECQNKLAGTSGDGFFSESFAIEIEVEPDRTPPAQPKLEASRVRSLRPAADGPVFLVPEQYEVIRELGRGGVGVVYLARHKLMDRLQILKVLNKDVLNRRGAIDRFLREIRVAARLNHPNVVSAYDAIQVGGHFVFVMEYIEGQDLARLVKTRGPLPVAHACYFAYQAALGIQHAYEKGTVHRDIKPGNLIVTRQGQRALVKVLDFGLSKAMRESPIDGTLTQEGQMLGTPDYIAPEQIINAQKADIRADVYSLGCTLYYLLTGTPPFRGASLYDTFQAHVSMEAVPLHSVRSDVPAALSTVVSRMMAKSPERRFQTPADVAEALRPFYKRETNQQSSSTPESPTPDNQAPPQSGAESLAWQNLIAIKEADGPVRTSGMSTPRKSRSALAVVMTLGLLFAAGVYAWTAGLFDVSTETRALPTSGRSTATGANEKARIKVQSNSSGALKPERDLSSIGSARPLEPSKESEAQSEPSRDATLAGLRAKSKGPDRSAAPFTKNADKDAQQTGSTEGAHELSNGASVADIQQVKARAGSLRFADVDGTVPIEPFWPALTPLDNRAWQLGDADSMKLSARGLTVTASPGGNFVLTRKDTYRKCALKASLNLSPGTELYLALHARVDSKGWRALTSQIVADKQGIHVRGQATDFASDAAGVTLKTLPPDELVVVAFEDNGNGRRRVLVRGKVVSNVNEAQEPGNDAGAVGFFVKSGTVVVRSLVVED